MQESASTASRGDLSQMQGRQHMSNESFTPQQRQPSFLTGFLSASLLGCLGFLAWQHYAPPAVNFTAPQATTANIRHAGPIDSQVAEELAQLKIKPKNIELTADRAVAAADALRAGDYKTADSLSREILAKSHLKAFEFAPFNRFMGHLSPGEDPQFLDGLDKWVAADPKSALARLVRANYYYYTAWDIRGPDFANAVTAPHWQGYKEDLKRAEADIHESIALDPGIPWSYFLWLKVAEGQGDPQRMDQVFETGIARFPGYYALYDQRLDFLEPKWGGSARAMHEFVNRYAGKAPASSPLKLLYLELSDDLLSSASIRCRSLQGDALSKCVGAYMNGNVTPGVTNGVAQAFALYKHTDPIEYSNALWPILGGLQSQEEGSSIINTVLQLAADAMGSDVELIHESAHNNYVLDDITARVWAHLDNPVNADQKFREALDDVAHAPFVSDEDRYEAMAAVYDEMTWVARQSSQYVRMIAYHDAANAVGGINHGGSQYLKCFAYYKLNRFREAVGECTELMHTHRDAADAQYYRARALEGLGQYDAAIADFKPIADDGSNNYIRWGAAIEMEHVMALQGNYQGELEFFRKYPFVFDTELQPPDDLAIAYNNRCFAYMKTGQLEKALEDCNTSLRYGRLPDAMQKQQQLLKQLGKSS
jgi:tetratricopeptide (TPR) repeat protein